MRFIFHSIIMVLLFLAASWIYQNAISEEDRYDIFDLLRRESVTAAIGVSEGPILAQAAKPTLRAKPLEVPSLGLLEQVNDALSNLTDAVVPSVVSIDTTKSVDVQRLVPNDPFGMFGYRRLNQRYESPGLGSGVIVSEEGHVVTNHHVVADVDAIQITHHDGTKYEAEWVGSDPGADIAVLKIKPSEGRPLPKFQPLAFGDSEKVRVGEMVLAVGNPFGLSETVTRGIISAKQRQLSDGANEYFQVDAVINPGNSGGPLINVRGEIIGINVAIFSGQQEVKVWQGIGLAIPSDEARAVFEAIVHGEPLIRGYLGLDLAEISRNYALALGLSSTRGALITNIAKGSPAETAGLKPGDVILKFDDKEVKTATDTLARIRLKKKSDTAGLEIVRKGQVMNIAVDVVAKSDTNSIKLKSDIAATGQTISSSLGLELRELTREERAALGLDAGSPAILITDVKKGSQAEKRFLPGDLIHRINRDPVSSVAEFYDLLGSLPHDRQSTMVLSRNGHRITAIMNP